MKKARLPRDLKMLDHVGEPSLSGEAAGDIGLVAKGGVLQMVGQTVHAVLSLGFTAVAVRILGTAGFGVYRQVTQVLMIASQISPAGFSFSAMHFIARARARSDHGSVRGAMRVALIGAGISSSVVFLVLFIGADLISEAFAPSSADAEQFSDLFRIGSPYVVAAAYMAVLCYITIGYKTVTPSVIAANFVQPMSRFLLGVGALWAGLGLVGVTVSFTVAMVVGSLAAAFYARRMLTPSERSAHPRANLREMLIFGSLQAVVHLLDLQTLGLGIILLGVSSSDRAVGLFAIALSLQGLGQLIQISISNIWNPVISDLYGRGDSKRIASLTQTINRWIVTFSLPVYMLLVVRGDLFFALLAGKEEANAHLVVALLAIGNLAYTSTGATAQLISMTGRPDINFVNSVVAVIVYSVVGLLAAERWGAVGLAVVDTTVLTAVSVARGVQVAATRHFALFGRAVWKPILATVCAAFSLLVARLLGNSDVVEVGGVIVALSIYLVVLHRLGLDREERFVLERIKLRFLELLRRNQ